MTMAHPIKHAESSARKFGGKAEDYLAFTTGSMNRKHSSPTFVTERFGIMLREFSCAKRCLARPSQIAMEIQFRCAMWGNSMSKKTWVAFPRHRTGSCRSSHNAGCMASV